MDGLSRLAVVGGCVVSWVRGLVDGWQRPYVWVGRKLFCG